MPKRVETTIDPADRLETLSDIEVFMKAYFKIELTSAQKEVIKAIVRGKFGQHNRLAGDNLIQQALRLYIEEGLNKNGRKRMPVILPPRHKVDLKHMTQHGRVLKLIQSPGGAYNFELSRIALKYTSVISDLRKEGHNIVADRMMGRNGKASNTWKYTIAGKL